MATLLYTDDLVSALDAFASQTEKNVTPELLKIVENISKTGVVCYSWNSLKTLLGHLLTQALKGYMAKVDKEALAAKGEDEDNDIEKRSTRFIYALESFDEAPFTVQRLCELILAPEKVYTSYFKYISALEKMVNITSTLPSLTAQQIQTINSTGVIPQNDEDNNNNNNNNNNNTNNNNNSINNIEAMNVDTNGVQTSFPQQINANSINNNDNNDNNIKDNNNNVNSGNFEEKSPTPMDL